MPKQEIKKDKGQAIEKILENSHKPWYINNQVADKIPSPKVLPDINHEVQSEANQNQSFTQQSGGTVYRNKEGAYMSRKRPLVQDGPHISIEKVPSKQKLLTNESV